MALLFSRVGNQVLVQVNGATVQRLGTLGRAAFQRRQDGLPGHRAGGAAGTPSGPTSLTIEVAIQPPALAAACR